MKNLKDKLQTVKGKVAAAGALAVSTVGSLGTQAMAAVDVTAAQAALASAETDAHSIGGTVIAIVAGLVVVGIIIALIRKA